MENEEDWTGRREGERWERGWKRDEGERKEGKLCTKYAQILYKINEKMLIKMNE